ncbi:acetyl/propionyl/methylcrotonyl-CoA carboxylase subunit alpha [Pseudooctadecabacter sp.]|uniref:acetyl/propionyl/methylcrotonyl-CoA carboxylase subunit alpha n=1 Tax=Pseudooctadecabacter sp. TaxID=1966338 RepID=UPI0035C80577
MFDKILIANRGEIACRVITTARRLGVRTVAVFSDADAGAKHVRLADEAAHIGASDVTESYLKGDRIIEAALKTGAQAIHPGYGFLSENPQFVQAVADAGLTFIGPSADAITAMGLKDAAKALMVTAGVPLVPGYHGADQDAAFLSGEADKIGYPVLIKARAGGGGKGMRLVEDPADFGDALAAAQREGQASFGDPACLIEKYITHPRHIEIQVCGDSHGNVIHLFERDCSLQRRHQKVIEEAPAPDMPDAVRAAMGKAAVEAARAINYVGAGTVEFIVDGSGPLREDGFWFMEMNTRLQVEHPVSEAITGLDFVELQLRVAAGEALPVQQEDLTINGWSMEARVYAEDVPKGFLPATGTLHHLSFPNGTAFERGSVRIDSGVDQGDEISPFYDPMIAKVIVHAPTRAAAASLMASTLKDCRIAGCVTNVEFLTALARHDGFRRGEVDTGLIARDLEALTAREEGDATTEALAAVAALDVVDENVGWAAMAGFRTWGPAAHSVDLMNGGDVQTHRVTLLGANSFDVDGTVLTIAPQPSGWRVTSEGQTFAAHVVRYDNTLAVFRDGRCDVFAVPDPLAQDTAEAGGSDAVTAPMPGVVSQVIAAAGDMVAKGDPLLILEAMKMEHTLRAPRDGTVAEVMCATGDQVSDGIILLQMDPADD